ncbi:hypothetical protein KM1_059670 [Entamoeba histolytica HM-3:IMSS]|uniref:Uncharacterized protein n=1 Tax=Entamoeba histolytica HM-3:IMSS TaxID=885315 RepID=M7WWG7_ENTHI|nr:hypothetical protein KM1_059670 [Entamoeba histolytica HM-3:IMSS]
MNKSFKEYPPHLPIQEFEEFPNIQITVKMALTKKNLRRHFTENNNGLSFWLDSVSSVSSSRHSHYQ